MLNLKPPNYKYCPFCGNKLTFRIEEGKKRKYCTQDKWTYYPHAFAASNAVIVKNGKILLVKRNRVPRKGKWMFPAGFLEYGEHPEENVIREVKEETGLTAYNPVFLVILQTKDDPRAPGNLTFYYKVRVKGKIKNSDKAENSKIKWFDLHDIPAIAWEDHLAIIHKLQKGEL